MGKLVVKAFIASVLLLFTEMTNATLLYSSEDVVQLTSKNFNELVTETKDVWIIVVYASWCPHSVNFSPEFEKAASKLKGNVNFGAADHDKERALAERLRVDKFPTVFISTGPDYHTYISLRKAEDIIKAVAKQFAGKNPFLKNDSNVFNFKENNFKEKITKSSKIWIVLFYSLTCQNCTNAISDILNLAKIAKNEFPIGAVDCLIQRSICYEYDARPIPNVAIVFKNYVLHYDDVLSSDKILAAARIARDNLN